MADDRGGRRRLTRRVRRALLVVLFVVVALAVVLGTRAFLVLRSVHTDARYWQARSHQSGRLLYVALGDSTAQGVGASTPRKGYVGLLADRLARDRGTSVRVVNLSVSGARAADVAREQLPRLREQLTVDRAPALVTITVGANDSGRTDPAAFRASVHRILQALPAGAEVADIPDFGRGSRADSAIALSRVISSELLARPDLVPVDLYSATRHFGFLDYGGDFFHPSDRGYRRYADAFVQADPRVWS